MEGSSQSQENSPIIISTKDEGGASRQVTLTFDQWNEVNSFMREHETALRNGTENLRSAYTAISGLLPNKQPASS